jgi:hypothetical protein
MAARHIADGPRGRHGPTESKRDGKWMGFDGEEGRQETCVRHIWECEGAWNQGGMDLVTSDMPTFNYVHLNSMDQRLPASCRNHRGLRPSAFAPKNNGVIVGSLRICATHHTWYI